MLITYVCIMMHTLFSGIFSLDQIGKYTVINDTVFFITNNSIINLKTNESYFNQFDLDGVTIIGDKFISNIDGSVYKLNEKFLLDRIDQSRTKLNQVNSSIFIKNDTIYKFGGYGYWSNKNYFTFFDENTKEWEVLKNNSIEFPIGVINPMFSIFEDNFVFFGGYALDKNEYVLIESLDNWKFNFSELKWEKLDELNINFNLNTQIKNSTYFDNYLLLVGEIKNYLIDFEKLKYYEFENSKLSKVLDKNLSNIVEFEGDIYFRINTSNGFKNEKLNLSQILKNSKDFNLYKTNYLEYWYFIIFTPIFFFFIKKKKKLPFDDLEMRILKLLLSNKHVLNSDLIELFKRDREMLNYHSITRIKNDFLNILNNKIKTFLKIEDYIVKSKRWDKDKRIKIYYIDDKKNILKKYLKD